MSLKATASSPINFPTTSFPSIGWPINGPCMPINYPSMGLRINYPSMPINGPCMGLPINYPSIDLPINGSCMSLPINCMGLSINSIESWINSMLLKINHPAIGLPVNATNWSILNNMPPSPLAPWPLYSSNLAIFWADAQNIEVVDLIPNLIPDLTVDTATHQSSEKDKADNDLIQSLLSEQIVQQNIVTNINVEPTTITVYISPLITDKYVRPDCENPTTVSRYDSDTIIAQGLGIQGKAVRYVVEMVRLSYINDEMKFKVFTASVLGLRSDLQVTDEVVETSMYFIIDRNLSLRVTAEMLYDLYRVETSSSALDRWKKKEAEALPSIGQLIQQLNAKKKITQLHLDEYKATGTKNWELCIKDEHGRLIFSISLKKRDTWHIKVILRWFRILGLKIKAFYCDFWLAYPPAIKAIYPEAEIQFDFFHVIQNIHRHLYKDFSVYRKLFKNSNNYEELKEAHQELHKRLWKNRYLLFTNEENLNDKERKRLDQLVEEHRGTIVEQIVVFRWYLRDIFNASDSYREGFEKLTTLIIDGWGEVSTGFAKVIKFLQEHFRNMATYLRVPGIQRNSLSECTVRTLRRIEKIRQGFKTHKGRINHLKLLIYRQYLRPTN